MKKLSSFGVIWLLLLVFASCGAVQQDTEADTVYLYYLNGEMNTLIGEEYPLQAIDTTRQIEEIYQAIAMEVEAGGQIPLLPADVKMQSWELREGTLWIDFNANYAYMEPIREVLIRAGIVRSFAAIKDVSAVGFLVDGEELVSTKGVPVGLMRVDDFVEDSGKEVNSYQYVTMKLYFANETGDKLRLEERKVYYSKNIPLERAVVEQILEGPQNEKNYPTIASETKILGVATMDGLGYVNLDQAFLSTLLPVKGEVAIQSIIRSVAENCAVNKVQISVNGESRVVFRENISLDRFFEVDYALEEVVS
jgi:Spore germination protein